MDVEKYSDLIIQLFLIFAAFAPIWYFLIKIGTQKLIDELTKESLIDASIIAGISIVVFYGVTLFLLLIPKPVEPNNFFSNSLLAVLWCVFVALFYISLLGKEIIILLIHLLKFKKLKTLFLLIPLLLCMAIVLFVSLTYF